MAFLDDARYTGRPMYGSRPWPRHYYTWAAIGTSLILWALMIGTVAAL